MKTNKSNKNPQIIIVSFNGTDNSGGVERVTYYLNEILSKKYLVRIITKTRFSFGKFDMVFQPLLASFRLFFIPNKLVIANSYQAFLFPSNIVIFHGTFKGNYMRVRPKKLLGSRIIAFMENIAAIFAKQILAVSINCKNELINFYGIKESKISVLNNFVDEELFFPCRNRINTTTILFCGRLEEGKGLSYLIVLSEYIEKMTGVCLRIATNNITNCEYFTNKKNTKIFPSLLLNNMPEFYNSGNVLFFPTLYEGFSMATLEALACGIPVIGSNFSVPEELCGYDFCKDITQKLGDPEYIINSINNLIKKYDDKREIIHDVIVKDFGKDQYKEKLFQYINMANNKL
jgi:glycosyltransferase involved in cell wall biosynthesis